MFASMRLPIVLSLILFSLDASLSCQGQVVQLPSFSRFSYSGSVHVPDRGSTSLGSVSRSASRTGRRNGFRSFAFSGGHSGASVHVTIIDHDAIDRQLRGLPPKPARGVAAAGGQMRTVNGLEQDTAAESGPDRIDPDSEGKALVRFARRQYRSGNHGLAREAYQIAFEKLSPKLADLAKREFERVFRERVAAKR